MTMSIQLGERICEGHNEERTSSQNIQGTLQTQNEETIKEFLNTHNNMKLKPATDFPAEGHLLWTTNLV